MSDPHPTSTPGLLLVISGPSGVGKTTITHEVERRLGGQFSVSATTRPKTHADVEGRDYTFVTEEQFRGMIDRGEFLEHAQVFGKHFYGTPRQPVMAALRDGKLMILEIDVQGALQIKKSEPAAFMLFILPPDDAELLRRLRSRGRENEETIQRRFAEAKREIELARSSGAYDHLIVNADLEAAIRQAIDLIQARRNTVTSAPVSSKVR